MVVRNFLVLLLHSTCLFLPAGILMGRHMLDPLKDLNKVGCIFKPYTPANRLYRFSILQHEAGMRHSNTVQIIHIGDPGQGFEPAAEVILTVAGFFGDLLDGDFPGKGLIGPLNQFLQAGHPETTMEGGITTSCFCSGWNWVASIKISPHKLSHSRISTVSA